MRLRDWIYQPVRSIMRVFDHSSNLQKEHEKQQQQYLDIIDNLQGMANAIPDAALVIDRNDVISWFNNPAKQLLDIKESADQGEVLTRLIPDPEFADWLAVQD